MNNINKNTVLDFLGVLFVSLSGHCVLNLTSECNNLYQCIVFCIFAVIIGLIFIFLKYYLREA
ncbi:MAG: hypothetical protein BWK75_06350 [Candidatus Altiarchaeales archaeon A3]|nr:MAG: hypothetical protein BWK75_06350 [Candidatus Altiarchaeales archaeon A3]